MNEQDVVSKLDELIEEVQQNRRWLRVLAWNDVLHAVSEALEEDWEYHLFEKLDGDSSTRELTDDLPKARNTILDRLDKWKQMGIIIQNSDGKYEKIVSLSVLNIDLPELNNAD